MATSKKSRKTRSKASGRARGKAKPKKRAKPPKKGKAKPKSRPKSRPKPKKKHAGKKAAAQKKRAKTPMRAKARAAAVPQEAKDFSLESKVQRQKDVAWRMIDGEAVIITPADSTMHTLNDVGTRIWELMTGTRTLREVAGVLCAEFEVERDRAEKDTIWFAECLAKKGLVENL